jgi:hypothetical protein
MCPQAVRNPLLIHISTSKALINMLTVIVTPLWMYGGASFVLSCVYVRSNMRFKFVFASAILYATVGFVLISSKADFIIPWSWTLASIVFFWVPDVAILVGVLGFAWADYHHSRYDYHRNRVTTFIWHLLVIASFIAMVRSQYFLFEFFCSFFRFRLLCVM